MRSIEIIGICSRHPTLAIRFIEVAGGRREVAQVVMREGMDVIAIIKKWIKDGEYPKLIRSEPPISLD